MDKKKPDKKSIWELMWKTPGAVAAQDMGTPQDAASRSKVKAVSESFKKGGLFSK